MLLGPRQPLVQKGIKPAKNLRGAGADMARIVAHQPVEAAQGDDGRVGQRAPKITPVRDLPFSV